MGQRFFRIAGGASYLVAALALIVAIVGGLGFIGGWITGVDDRVRHPDPGFAEYRESVKPSPAQRSNNESAAQSAATPDKQESQISELVFDLVKKIGQYAERTKQDDVSPQGVREWVDGIGRTFREREDTRIYLSRLNKSFDQDLLKPALTGSDAIKTSNIPGLERSGSQYVHWDKYLQWYANTYMRSYEAELERIEAERLEQLEARSDSLSSAMLAAGAFVVFLLATLVLLLVRIELNTRQSVA
ncbi:MAG: hypothetical protein ACK4SX_03300 [Alcanivoracaceae bacterium]